jgi:hypothetical protein
MTDDFTNISKQLDLCNDRIAGGSARGLQIKMKTGSEIRRNIDRSFGVVKEHRKDIAK